MKRILSLDIKYSGIQLLFFGSLSALMGFASVYLLSKGFSNSMIGIALSAVSIIVIFTQPTVASFADKNQHIELRKIIAIILLIAVLLTISLFFLGKGTILLLCAFVGVGTCMSTLTPLLNSLAFMFEKYGIEINYGLGRGIGSGAYALVSFGLGYLAEGFGEDVIPMTYLAFNVLLIFVVYSFVIPKNEKKQAMAQEVVKEEVNEEKEEEEENQLSFVQFGFKYKKFMVFILGLVFVYFTHTIINNFLIQIITPIGGTESDMGTAVFLAAILELPAMLFFNNIREKINCSTLIKIAVVAFVVKHTLTYFATSMIMIYVAQCFQMIAYAVITPATVYYANQVISKSDLVKGQSLITMAYTGSGIIANLIGGFLLDSIGVHSVLLLGVGISIIGAVVVIFTVDNKEVSYS